MPQTKISQYFQPRLSLPSPDPKTNTAMSSSQELNEKKSTGFLDLPGEIRNQIYHMLLPDQAHQPLYFYEGSRLRRDGAKTSGNFMGANRQMNQEAADILYGDKEFELLVHRDGTVTFLGHDVAFADIDSSNFLTLNQIRELSIIVSSTTGHEVCNVQDALFKVLAHFHEKHKLHTLHVSLNISSPGGDWGYAIFTSNYAERMYKVDIMREFRDIYPGDISRGHLAAFLTDPLRTLRGLKKNGKKQPKFSLDFVGKSGRPWRDLKGEVFTLIKGSSPVPDYKVFAPYYDALRALLKFVRDHDLLGPHVSKLSELARSRIHGDVAAFRMRLQSFWSSFCQRTQQRLTDSRAASTEELEQKEYQVRELEHLIEALNAKLPMAGADTSFFGYNSADDALRQWQRYGRQEEKEVKEKRKQEKEKRKREVAEDAEAASQSRRKKAKL